MIENVFFLLTDNMIVFAIICFAIEVYYWIFEKVCMFLSYINGSISFQIDGCTY